jgi:hypothetical protein
VHTTNCLLFATRINKIIQGQSRRRQLNRMAEGAVLQR